jgi:hypothetical protein
MFENLAKDTIKDIYDDSDTSISSASEQSIYTQAQSDREAETKK